MRQGNGDAGYPVHANATVADAIAAVLKREGVEIVFGYPRNQILEAAARIDIRTVIVRQERTGLHMADAVSRMSKGGQMGVFVMQQGPGAENAFGGVARDPKSGARRAAMGRNERFDGLDFEPKIGDVVYTFHSTPDVDPATGVQKVDAQGRPKTVAHNHIFIVAEVAWNAAGTGGTIHSVDGGQAARFPKQDDGSCHSVHVNTHNFTVGRGVPLDHINTWIRLEEMWPAFTGNYVEPIRNRNNAPLPHDPAHAQIP